MIIYKDVVTGDEVISDTWKIIDTGDGLWEIDGKKITVGGDDFVLAGANPSAEEGDEDGGGDGTSEQVIDLVHSFRWNSIPRGEKKDYQKELKNYAKAVLAKLTESGKTAEAEAFKKTAQGAMKKILANFNDYDVYLGESMDPAGMWILMNYREDGITPYATIWRYGLEEEKV